MLNNWVFLVAAVLIVIAEIQYIMVLRKQYRLFRERSTLQPLKRLLFTAVLLLMFGAAPLLFVYIDIVWLHYSAQWIVYMAVLANAFAKVITGFILNKVYDFRSQDEDLF